MLIWLSPTVQVRILGHAGALFPLKNPGLVTIPLAFLAGIVTSLLLPERAAAERFAEVEQRLHLGADLEAAAEPNPGR